MAVEHRLGNLRHLMSHLESKFCNSYDCRLQAAHSQSFDDFSLCGFYLDACFIVLNFGQSLF